MPHRVMGIIDTAFNSLITDIDGIASCLGDGRLVGDQALVLCLSSSGCHTDGTCLKGILMIHVVALMQGEAGLWGILPLACLFRIACGDAVVIHDDLIFLPVALTGCKHHGTSLLQHRNQIGRDDGLCEEILAGAEEGWALPLPFVLGDIVVDAMTGPDAEVTVLQPFVDGVGA